MSNYAKRSRLDKRARKALKKQFGFDSLKRKTERMLGLQVTEYRRYPPDTHTINDWKTNYVCVDCETHARRAYANAIEDDPRCPSCQKPMWALPLKAKVPKKRDRKGWKKLAARIRGCLYFPYWEKKLRELGF